jgi:hypothetical protein
VINCDRRSLLVIHRRSSCLQLKSTRKRGLQTLH